jgi:transcriptional regulator with XRE-family HTH domain
MDDETGERIRQLRIARGMAQADLAEQIGVSKSYLSHIEAGRRPVGDEMRQQIAAALDVCPEQLQDGVPADKKEELRLKLSFGEMALRNGDWPLAVQTFSDALATARTLPLERFVDECCWGMARALEATGELEEAIVQYEDLAGKLQLSPGVSLPALQVALLRAYNESGDLSRAIDVGEHALAAAPVESSREAASLVELISTLAGCYVERGDLTRAQVLVRKALELADREGSPRARAAAAWEAAIVAHERHDNLAATAHAERAVALFQELDNERAVGLLHVVAAGLLLRREQPPTHEARSLLRNAQSVLEVAGTGLDLAYVHTEEARALLLDGRINEAVDRVSTAIEDLGEGDRLQRARLLVLLGHALRAQGNNDHALASLRDAAQSLRDLGAARQAAKAWRELGEAYDELGRQSEAIDAMRRASDLAGVGYSPAVLGAAVGESVRD